MQQFFHCATIIGLLIDNLFIPTAMNVYSIVIDFYAKYIFYDYYYPQPSGSQYMVQVPLSSFTNQGEMITSSNEAGVSPLVLQRVKKRETETGECDTTQVDDESQGENNNNKGITVLCKMRG